MENEFIFLDKIEEILQTQEVESLNKRKNGQNFNLLKIIGAESSELSHSRIIGDLLNPNSTSKHGQGDKFLRLFLKQINKESWINGVDSIKLKGKIIEREIGEISKNKETGGRIDIVIEFQDKLIIIENKINAEDQEKQLIRYSNYGKSLITDNKINDFELIYLTLNGKNASEYSCGNIDYHLLSYEKDILGWLEECKKECNSMYRLMDSISQYCEIIKTNKIWRQITDYVMSSDINVVSILKGHVNISNYPKTHKYVSDSNFVNHIKAKIQQSFWLELEKELGALREREIISNIIPEYNLLGHDSLIWHYYKEKAKKKNLTYGIKFNVDRSEIRIALNGNGCVLKYLPNTKPMYLKINTSENSKIDINFNLFNESLVKEMVDEDRRKVLIHQIVEGIISDFV
ncbi:MAG: PD-(D/E)XK nuclease family protein [Bacteroidales bacterium]